MSRRLVGAVAGLGLFAMHLPLLLLIAWSFNASRTGARWDGFTIGWYTRLLERPDLLRALWTSLVVGTISTLLATALGTGAALAWRVAGSAAGRSSRRCSRCRSSRRRSSRGSRC
jgi:putrescine transport system permease protein